MKDTNSAHADNLLPTAEVCKRIGVKESAFSRWLTKGDELVTGKHIPKRPHTFARYSAYATLLATRRASWTPNGDPIYRYPESAVNTFIATLKGFSE